MTSRGLMIFAAVTVLLIAGAAAFYPGGTTTRPEPGPPFFPNLAKAMAGATTVEITAKAKTFSLTRDTKGAWRVKEMSGYLVKEGAVRQVLVALAELRPYERKTAEKDRLDKLDLEDPKKKGSSAKRVTVKDAKGKVLADIIVGKENPNSALLGYDMVYVRRPKEDQAWLAIGKPVIADDPDGWAKKRLMNVSADRIKTVEQIGEGGAKVSLEQKTPGGGFTITNKPEGREARNAKTTRYLAETLEKLDLSEVKKALEVDSKKHAFGQVTYRTFDGLVVVAKIARIETGKDKKGKPTYRFWITFAASVDGAIKPPKNAKLKSAAEVKKEAAAINATVAGWIYDLPSTSERFMTYTMEDLLKPAKKSPPKKAPEKKAPEKKPEETKAPEKKPDEKKPVDKKPDAPKDKE